MRKWTLLIAILALNLSSLAFAEDIYNTPALVQRSYRSSESGFGLSSINLLAGGSVSDLAGISQASPKFGFQGGVTMDFGRSHFVFEPGLLFIQEGAYVSASSGTTSVDGEVDYNYLAVPLLAKYYLQGQKTHSFFVEGGAVPQFMVSSSGSVDISNGTSTTSVKQDNLNANVFDIGLEIGIGERFVLEGKTSLTVLATYMRGLTNVTSSMNGAYSRNNSVFGFAAAFGFSM